MDLPLHRRPAFLSFMAAKPYIQGKIALPLEEPFLLALRDGLLPVGYVSSMALTCLLALLNGIHLGTELIFIQTAVLEQERIIFRLDVRIGIDGKAFDFQFGIHLIGVLHFITLEWWLCCDE